ncbi:MAG: sulfurtransferase FdhD, partial [Sphingobium sp.]|nr:sulfurtransferase FdhD [Sphingobium sp.]
MTVPPDPVPDPQPFLRLTPDGATAPVDRPLAREMPVAIEYNGAGYAVLMATPDNIVDLV